MLGVEEETVLVLGGADGPLSNLGFGSARNGCSDFDRWYERRTSVYCRRTFLHPQGETFCFALDEQHWVIGGASSNGAVALDWASQTILQKNVSKLSKTDQSL